MKYPALLSLVASAALTACATVPNALPVCDGKHRRPANPHGSVLGPATPAGPTAPSTGAASSQAAAAADGCQP